MKKFALVLAALAALPTGGQAANLLVNGNFEASSSQTITPPGWTNIGHSDGVIAYSVFGTPAYDGNYYYDIGGYGGALPAAGDGITQSVATVIGGAYTLTFGYSSENVSGVTFLDVLIGSQFTQYALPISGTGAFLKPFTTVSINYVATGISTAISFTVSPQSSSFGNNDPLIDGVIFDGATGAVPEPATWAMMLSGFGLVGAAARRRRLKALAA